MISNTFLSISDYLPAALLFHFTFFTFDYFSYFVFSNILIFAAHFGHTTEHSAWKVAKYCDRGQY